MNKKHCEISRYKLTIEGNVGSTITVYLFIRFPNIISGTNYPTYRALLSTIRYFPSHNILFKSFTLENIFLQNDGQLSNNLMRKFKIRNFLSIQFYTNDSYEIFRIIQNLPLLLYKNNNNHGYINRRFREYTSKTLECIKKQLLLPRKENNHK